MILAVLSRYETVSTKSACQVGRGEHTDSCRDQTIDDTTCLETDRETFLSNKKNKQGFLRCLGGKCEAASMSFVQCKADADCTIVTKTLELAEGGRHVVCVAEDTDLLLLALHHYDEQEHGEVLLYPEDKHGANSTTTPPANVRIMRANLKLVHAAGGGDVLSVVLPLHSLFGCDTTSAISGLGKIKCVNKAANNPKYAGWLGRFCQPLDGDVEEFKALLVEDAVNVLLFTYNEKIKPGTQLNEVRYRTFADRAKKSIRAVDLKGLPPTLGAFKQHVYRSYLQCRQWMGDDSLDPSDWGFKQQALVQMPVASRNHVAPRALLLMFACGCAQDACKDNRCSCRKNGVACTDLCTKCRGLSCENEATECDDFDITGDANPVVVALPGQRDVPRLKYTIDSINKMKVAELVTDLRCYGIPRGKGADGKATRVGALRAKLIECVGLEAPTEDAASDSDSDSEASDGEALEEEQEEDEFDVINVDELVVAVADEACGAAGVLAADTLEGINDYLGFDYMEGLREHMAADDELNKVDDVAVAQRLKQWQSSKGAQLSSACEAITTFTGTINATIVEEHFRDMLAADTA